MPLTLLGTGKAIEKHVARVHRRDARARDRHARRVRRARHVPVLRVLGGDADPDVPADRDLGRSAPAVRVDQVRDLHDGRLAADARRDLLRLHADGPVSARTRPISRVARVALPYNAQVWCFAAFALAFAIKVPLFPLHTWLPDAHVEAPTAGSVILAGVLLKFGIYGFLRYAMPMFPHGAAVWAPALRTSARTSKRGSRTSASANAWTRSSGSACSRSPGSRNSCPRNCSRSSKP